MFRVFYSNFRYFSGQEFETIDLAFAHAKEGGFQATIYQGIGEKLVGSWCPIAGQRTYN